MINKLKFKNKTYIFDIPLKCTFKEHEDGIKEIKIEEIKISGFGKTLNEAWDDLKESFDKCYRLVKNPNLNISKRVTTISNIINYYCRLKKTIPHNKAVSKAYSLSPDPEETSKTKAISATAIPVYILPEYHES